MKIVSIIKDSFQEYVGEQSLVLFSHGCNLDCYHCHNKEMVTQDTNIIGDAIDLIDRNITPMHTAVVFLGGEPTIWGQNLVDAAAHVKTLGLKVKIFTNGTYPEIVDEINTLGICDSWSIDFKCLYDCKTCLGVEVDSNDYLESIDKSVCSCLVANVPLEIRTTSIAGANEKQMEEIHKYITIRYPGISHIVQQEFFVNENRRV